jgi:hypothetical protein
MPEITSLSPATPADMRPQSQISYAPSNIRTDAARYLPPSARDRLEQLQQHVDDLRSVIPEFE